MRLPLQLLRPCADAKVAQGADQQAAVGQHSQGVDVLVSRIQAQVGTLQIERELAGRVRARLRRHEAQHVGRGDRPDAGQLRQRGVDAEQQ